MSNPNPSEEALEAALDQYEGDLRAYARALLPNWNAVDETMQDACLVMWRKFDQLESPDEFLPWAKVVLRFEALKTRRKYARDRHVFSDELIEMLAREGLEDRSDQTALEEALSFCLDTLSPDYRELVLAPYQADHAVTDIAERSGRTVNSLYKLLGRLRLKLRECVDVRVSFGPAEGATS